LEPTEQTDAESPNSMAGYDVKEIENLIPCEVVPQGVISQDLDMFKECLYLRLEDLQGADVILQGFVLKDDTLPENVIIVARQIISCCAADAMPYGFSVLVENADDFEAGEWLSVSGMVEVVIMQNYGDYLPYPIITSGSVMRRQALPLDEQYIAP